MIARVESRRRRRRRTRCWWRSAFLKAVNRRRRSDGAAGGSAIIPMLRSAAAGSGGRHGTATTSAPAGGLLLLLLLVMSCRWTIRGFPAVSFPSRGGPSSLADLLPRDLDALPRNETRILGALGIQLLAFGGWSRRREGDDDGEDGGGSWERRPPPSSRAGRWSVRDRLAFVTPTWKRGGSLDYGPTSEGGIFEEGAELLEEYRRDDDDRPGGAVASVDQLARLLEDEVGLDAATDLDAPAIAALRAMLSWQISLRPPNPPAPAAKAEQQQQDGVLLLVLSFGAKGSCRGTADCPFGPGATNELLAATAARFAQLQQQEHAGNVVVRILAQWEVATALRQNHGDMIDNGTCIVESFGTPGSYETTADILEAMLCAWGRPPHPDGDIRIQSADLLAHPDHLRRVLWTAQTILRRKRSHLRTEADTTCTLPPPDARLRMAMQPYRLDWPAERNLTTHHNDDDGGGINLFGLLGPTEVRTGPGNETTTVDWYDRHLGFFADDGNDQEWTQRRDVWILYDQWAVLKGIVSGTIDLPPGSISIN